MGHFDHLEIFSKFKTYYFENLKKHFFFFTFSISVPDPDNIAFEFLWLSTTYEKTNFSPSMSLGRTSVNGKWCGHSEDKLRHGQSVNDKFRDEHSVDKFGWATTFHFFGRVSRVHFVDKETTCAKQAKTVFKSFIMNEMPTFNHQATIIWHEYMGVQIAEWQPYHCRRSDLYSNLSSECSFLNVSSEWPACNVLAFWAPLNIVPNDHVPVHQLNDHLKPWWPSHLPEET